MILLIQLITKLVLYCFKFVFFFTFFLSVVFVQSPNLIRDVFFYEGKYPKHPLPEAWTYYNQLHNCQRGLFFMNDTEWMETRKQLAPLMLRNEQRFFAAIECATDDLISNWKQNMRNDCGWSEIPQPLTSLYGWSIRVLMGIMFGNVTARLMCTELREKIDYFAQIVQNVFEDTVPFASISPKFARRMRLSIWKNFEQNVTETLRIADEIIAFGLKRQQQQRHDDGLLAELDGFNMTVEMIRRVFIDLIIAAGDTTAFSTQWALYLLAKYPNHQEIIRHELMNAQATATTTTNRFDTPLIRGTVREALRLFPVATLIGRILEKDAILSDYHIDKYTLVLISMYSAGRDETSFPNANQFEPSRWNRDPITGTLNCVNRAQSSIPYAMGARNCIGQRIANAQMHIILSKLLRTFHIDLLNPNEIDIVMRLIIMPSKPMRFAVKCID